MKWSQRIAFGLLTLSLSQAQAAFHRVDCRSVNGKTIFNGIMKASRQSIQFNNKTGGFHISGQQQTLPAHSAFPTPWVQKVTGQALTCQLNQVQTLIKSDMKTQHACATGSINTFEDDVDISNAIQGLLGPVGCTALITQADYRKLLNLVSRVQRAQKAQKQ